MNRLNESLVGRSLATRRDVIAAISFRNGESGNVEQERARDTRRNYTSHEAIHQEVLLTAAPERVYSALTDPEQFQKVTLLSAAVTSGMVKSTKAAQMQPRGRWRVRCSEGSFPGASSNSYRTSALSRLGARRTGRQVCIQSRASSFTPMGKGRNPYSTTRDFPPERRAFGGGVERQLLGALKEVAWLTQGHRQFRWRSSRTTSGQAGHSIHAQRRILSRGPNLHGQNHRGPKPAA